MKNRKQIMDQIRKILALTKSPEPGEAQAALARLAEIMEKYGITPHEVQAAEMEAAREPHRNKTVSDLESALLNLIVRHYGCGVILDCSTPGTTILHIYGRAPMPEISRYAWKFLSRRMREDKKAFSGRLSKRLTQKSRNERIYQYQKGWLLIVANKLEKLNPFPGLTTDEIESYNAAFAASLGMKLVENTPRNSPGKESKTNKRTSEAFTSGMWDAMDVELNRPLNQPIKGQLQ